MAIEAFSNFNIEISDGGTVPSIDYLAYKTYVDIGSGNVFKVFWDTPSAANNLVDSYCINIQVFDRSAEEYVLLHKANIGNVNEFYIRSSLFTGRQVDNKVFLNCLLV